MTRQLDLLGHAGLEIEPEAGRSEPRLWIRRFVIWSEPGVMTLPSAVRGWVDDAAA